MRAETRRQSILSFNLIWECVCKATQFFHCSVYVHKWLQTHLSIFRGYKFYQVSEFTNTESVNNEDLLYVFLVLLQIDLLIKIEFIISKIL